MTASIHEAAASGFDAAAEVYARARPGYPDEILDAIAEATPAGDAPVLDLAAGTGKLTAGLAARLTPVIAAEPVEGMRREFRRGLPNLALVGATAEHLPFARGSLRAVTVAQALHWFDLPAALGALHRVLVRDGRIAIVFNVRDDRVAWVGRLWERLDRYDPNNLIPRHRRRGWEPLLRDLRFIEDRERHVVEHTQPMTVDGLLERVASVSFIARLDSTERARVERIVHDLCASDPDLAGRERFEYPYRCELTLLRKR